MTYNVGDRVRFIVDNRDGGPEYGRTGEIGIISRPFSAEMTFANGPEAYFVFENPNRMVHGYLSDEYLVPISCIEPVTPPDTQEIIRYAVVYQYPESNGPSTSFSATEALATKLCRLVEANNGMILAKKKIKLVVPVVTFPELTVDEDDNIVEEEDDDNAF